MAEVVIVLPGPLRRLVGGPSEVPAQGDDLVGVLASLAQHHPRLTDRILDGDGQPRPFLRLFLNGTDVAAGDGLATRVGEGDRVAIVLAIAGG